MDKRSWLFVFLSLLGLVSSIAIFLAYYKYVEEETWVGFGEGKDSDRYYMAGQFLRENGVEVTFKSTVNQLFPLPTTETAIFLATETDYLSETQVYELVDWVTAGGQLILYANAYFYTSDSDFAEHEDFSRYSLLDGLGLSIERSDWKTDDEDEADETDEAINELESGLAEVLDKATKDSSATLNIPNQNKSINIGPWWAVDRANIYYAEEILTPLVEVGLTNDKKTAGLVLGSYRLGEGVVTVTLASSYIFSDEVPLAYGLDYIEDSDYVAKPYLMDYNNASYLLYSMGNVALPEKLIWVEMGAHYSLLDLIRKHALMIVICTILFILAWLWYSLSRFGSIQVDSPRQSLSIAKHIAAVGEFLSQDSGRPRLIEACYKALDRDIYQKVDANRLISQDKLIDKIVARTELPKIMVAQVLKREYPDNDKDYLQLIHNILTIRERL